MQRQNTKAKAFNLNFRYIHDVLSINNPNFANWIPLLYPQKLVKMNTKNASSASLLDIYYHFTLLLEKAIRVSKMYGHMSRFDIQCNAAKYIS
jgi:hypothetical protein